MGQTGLRKSEILTAAEWADWPAQNTVCIVRFTATIRGFLARRVTLNGAMEQTPQAWNDERLNQWARAQGLAPLEVEEGGSPKSPRHWCDSIGREAEGVRCVAMPCLSTLIGDQFDCVLVDEP